MKEKKNYIADYSSSMLKSLWFKTRLESPTRWILISGASWTPNFLSCIYFKQEQGRTIFEPLYMILGISGKLIGLKGRESWKEAYVAVLVVLYKIY